MDKFLYIDTRQRKVDIGRLPKLQKGSDFEVPEIFESSEMAIFKTYGIPDPLGNPFHLRGKSTPYNKKRTR